jgi:hypothetical protein
MVRTLVVLIAALGPLCADAGGVTGGPFRTNKVEQVGKDVVHGEGVAGQLASVPDDDAGKWQVLLFTGPNCAPCNALKAAFSSNQNLRALAADDNSAWAHLQVYDASNESQKFRLKDYEVTQFPTLVVTTPVGAKLCPYVQVYRTEGFDGDADGLAQRMVEAITAFATKYPPRLTVSQHGEAGAPWGSQPNCPPNSPCPPPYQNQFSLPNLPNVDINLHPNEWPPRRTQQQPDRRQGWFDGDIENLFSHLWKLVLFLIGLFFFLLPWIVIGLLIYWLIKRRPQHANSSSAVQPQYQQQPQWQGGPTAQPTPPQGWVASPQANPNYNQAMAGVRAAIADSPSASYKPSTAALSAVQRAQAAEADRDAAIKAADAELAKAAEVLAVELQAVHQAKTSLPIQEK